MNHRVKLAGQEVASRKRPEFFVIMRVKDGWTSEKSALAMRLAGKRCKPRESRGGPNVRAVPAIAEGEDCGAQYLAVLYSSRMVFGNRWDDLLRSVMQRGRNHSADQKAGSWSATAPTSARAARHKAMMRTLMSVTYRF